MELLDEIGLRYFYVQLKKKFKNLETKIENIESSETSSISYDKIIDAPTKLSQFTNDAGYILASDLVTINNQSLIATDTVKNIEITGGSETSGGLTESEVQSLIDNTLKGKSYLTSVPVATTSAYGGIKLGYSESGKNYAVKIDSNGKAYVNVPWVASTGGTVDLSDYYTSAQVDSLLTDYAKTTALDSYATKEYVTSAVTTAVSNVKDTNTTYTISKSDDVITLSASDGTSSQVEVTNTIYTLTRSGNDIIMLASDGGNSMLEDVIGPTYTSTGLISISSENVISTTATSDSAIDSDDIAALCDTILV